VCIATMASTNSHPLLSSASITVRQSRLQSAFGGLSPPVRAVRRQPKFSGGLQCTGGMLWRHWLFLVSSAALGAVGRACRVLWEKMSPRGARTRASKTHNQIVTLLRVRRAAAGRKNTRRSFPSSYYRVLTRVHTNPEILLQDQEPLQAHSARSAPHQTSLSYRVVEGLENRRRAKCA